MQLILDDSVVIQGINSITSSKASCPAVVGQFFFDSVF